jgi:hypothetical protein
MDKELLLEGKENTTSVNVREISPAGTRLDITVAGKVSGKVTGQIMSTHNILMKPGGTSELEVKSLIFSNGEPIFVMGKVTGKLIDPTPIGRIEGNLTIQTPSQKLAYLNTIKGWLEATYNMATGEYSFKIYVEK